MAKVKVRPAPPAQGESKSDRLKRRRKGGVGMRLFSFSSARLLFMIVLLVAGLILVLAVVLTVARMDVPVAGSNGRVAPKRWAYIRPLSSGIVYERFKREGDMVYEGEQIATLLDTTERDEITRAKLDLERERQNLDALALQDERNRIGQRRAAHDLGMAQAMLREIHDFNATVPPIEILDLHQWIEAQITAGRRADKIVPQVKSKIEAIRKTLEPRIEQLLERRAETGAEGHPEDVREAFMKDLKAAETRLLEAAAKADLGAAILGDVDLALDGLQDTIFDGLRSLGRLAVATAASGAGAQAGEGKGGQGETFVNLRKESRNTRLEIRRLQGDVVSVARIKDRYGEITGERSGELIVLRKLYREFIQNARGLASPAAEEDPLAGPWNGQEARGRIGRLTAKYLERTQGALDLLKSSSGSRKPFEIEQYVEQIRKAASTCDGSLQEITAMRKLVDRGIITSVEYEKRVLRLEREVSDLFLASNGMVLKTKEYVRTRLRDGRHQLRRNANNLDANLRKLRALVSVQKDLLLKKARDSVDDRTAKYDLLMLGGRQTQALRANLEIRIKQAELRLKIAETRRRMKRIVAPMGGKITEMHVFPGEAVSFSNAVGIVEDQSEWYFKCKVEGKDFARLKEEQHADVYLDFYPYRTYEIFKGEVVEITPGLTRYEVEPGNRTWNVRLLLKDLKHVVKSEYTGRAEIIVDRQPVIMYLFGLNLVPEATEGEIYSIPPKPPKERPKEEPRKKPAAQAGEPGAKGAWPPGGAGGRPGAGKPQAGKPTEAKPSGENKEEAKPSEKKPDKPEASKPGDKKPVAARPGGGSRPAGARRESRRGRRGHSRRGGGGR